MGIKVLDCTLRDGGYVNNFNFGKKNKLEISKKLISAGVEIVEIGFLKNGIHNRDLTYYNRISDAEKFISHHKTNQKFCLMVRPDWYDINFLENATEKIDTLRFAFHSRDFQLAIKQAETARDIGYSIFLNPVNITSYTDLELKNLLIEINLFQPEAVSIVDTFGSLLPKRFNRILEIFNDSLSTNITLGLHLHENLSFSMGIANQFLEKMFDVRDLIIDSSLLGMGRVPGNLCTELLTGWLNVEYGKKYNQFEIFDVIHSTIKPIRDKFVWGYLPEYAKTGFDKLHRDYAEYLMAIPDLNMIQIIEILEKISIAKLGNTFHENIADQFIDGTIK